MYILFKKCLIAQKGVEGKASLPSTLTTPFQTKGIYTESCTLLSSLYKILWSLFFTYTYPLHSSQAHNSTFFSCTIVYFTRPCDRYHWLANPTLSRSLFTFATVEARSPSTLSTYFPIFPSAKCAHVMWLWPASQKQKSATRFLEISCFLHQGNRYHSFPLLAENTDMISRVQP